MKKKNTDPIIAFAKQVKKEIIKQKNDSSLKRSSLDFYSKCSSFNYSYHFNWLGRPIIQFPQDIVAVQELIWEVKPDCIIETGIAHGGSLILSSSMIELLHNNGKVIGVDIDIRKHNKTEIEKHPLFKNITLLEGSSVDKKIVAKVKQMTKKYHTIMVILDSNHTYKHVFEELKLYSPFVSRGSYIVVFDTVVEYMPKKLFLDRQWGKGNNPLTAVREFLKKNKNFRADNMIDSKLLLTCAPGGYLKRIK